MVFTALQSEARISLGPVVVDHLEVGAPQAIGQPPLQHWPRLFPRQAVPAVVRGVAVVAVLAVAVEAAAVQAVLPVAGEDGNAPH